MKIKSCHFDGLRTIPDVWWHCATQEEYDSYARINGEKMFGWESFEKLCEAYTEAYERIYPEGKKTYDDLLAMSKASFKSAYVDAKKDNETHIFILTNIQEATFKRFMQEFDLWKYKVFETDWAGNSNYPERKVYHCLKAFIFHYKD